ncbi:hypothetical protein CKC_05785 [Candidatus Liberibacter solanacearum CLso-ZC1]|uniref:Uncharacterized protein n=1 Tax=Liberibacter solanacearum (strain CLso-ZC1) TaxID=658172 RepID=E4UC50_LIBSC|nr:hypothetical protein [Candidatus Liberibacter solanacearum]ADR51940.1 hypothetical protein CKC_00945 [Candidatus Liberibacter solanacearum CLso-ZC1]ADR52902.1 hypothetical protein CKC_05785 [Candidatus Liberibacter solanacearum CLso-ZC1]
MPREQQKNPWSKGLSNIFQGATSGAMVGGPWGALAGGLLGGATSVIDYLFSGSDKEEDNKQDNKQDVLDKPAYMLTDEEREREEEKESSWMNPHSYLRHRPPASMLLAGGYSR